MNQHRVFKALLLIMAAPALVALSGSPTSAAWRTNGNPLHSIYPGNRMGPESVPDGAGGAIVAWTCSLPGIPGGQVLAQRMDATGAALWADGVCLNPGGDGNQLQILSDGAGGAIVVWETLVAGDWGIGAQRLDASGAPLWTVGGVPICAVVNYQVSPQITTDGAGGAIITWEDHRSGSYRIYAQRVSAAGVAQWTTNGIAVCASPAAQESPAIASDGAGGAVVAWEDSRVGDLDIYAQRVGPTGTLLWGSAGIPLCAAAAPQTAVRVIPDGVGGAIAAWEDRRGASLCVYAQRVNSSGAALWAGDGVRLCTDGGGQYKPVVSSDGAGGAVVAWSDLRSEFSDIYAQRIRSTGTLAWTPTGLAVCAATRDQYGPAMQSDGVGGVIVSWHDNRGGYFTEDIYAQRLSAGGGARWASSGLPVCTATDSQQGPSIASDGSGGAVISWVDCRNGAAGIQIYAQRVYAGACESAAWLADGNEMSAAPYGQRYPQIVPDGSEGAILVWQDNRTTADWDLYGQRVDVTGCALWAPGGAAISTAVRDQSFPQLAADASGGVFLAWEDYRNNNAYADIHAQHVDGQGHSRWAADGFPVCTTGGMRPYEIADGSGGAIIAWVDYRGTDPDLPNVYVQRVGASGDTLLWGPAGVAVCKAAGVQGWVRLVPDGAGGAVVVWEDNRSGNYDIYAQRVSGLGVVQWAANGVPVCAAAYGQRSPQVVSDGSGGAIVVWQDKRLSLEWDLFAQRIDGSGSVRWAVNGVGICTAAHDQMGEQMVSDGSGGAVITWEDYRNGTDYDIYAQRVNSAGAVQWAANGVALCTAAYWQRYPQLMTDGSGGAVVSWQDNRTTLDWDLYAQRIDGSGNVRWAANGVGVCTAVHDQAFQQMAAGGSVGGIVVWEDYRSGSSYDIYAGHLAVDGTVSGVAEVVPPLGLWSRTEPNPFRERTRVSYAVGVAGEVHLEIYDVAGRLVRRLVDGWRPAGEQRETWDGRRDDGSATPPGVYFYRLQVGGMSGTHKMVLVR